jgi:ribose transport system permease protein
MYALAAVLAAYSSRWGSLAGIVVPIVTCGAIGLVQGTLIGKLRMPAFIVTLAGLLFARGLAFKVSDNGNTTHLIDSERWMTNLGQERVLGVGAPVWIALALFGIGLVVLNRTRFGQAVYAIGGSEDAALLMGLRVARVKMILYTMTGLLSGLAGMLVAARSSSGLSTIGSGLELEAIAAVVIGGTLLSGGAGGLTGTMIGVLLLGVIQNLINQVGTLRSFHQQVVSGVFLIVVVTAQTIIGRREQS